MNNFEHVLIQRGNHLLSLISKYENELSKLEKGTIFVRKMGNASFVYKKHKENGVTVSTYVGKVGSEQAKNALAETKKYKITSKKINEAKSEFDSVLKAIRSFRNKRTNYINKKVKIDFKLSKQMLSLIKKAEYSDTLDNYGAYMNYVYAIDSQAKKECTYHLMSESQWNKLMMRYCL